MSGHMFHDVIHKYYNIIFRLRNVITNILNISYSEVFLLMKEFNEKETVVYREKSMNYCIFNVLVFTLVAQERSKLILTNRLGVFVEVINELKVIIHDTTEKQ